MAIVAFGVIPFLRYTLLIMKKEYSVYIVRCSDKTLYTGIAKVVSKRIKAHNSGRGARYTKTRRPVTLVYCEGKFTCGDALKKERMIKKLPRTKKLALLKKRYMFITQD